MISIVITVGDLPMERRAPVLSALHENLANPRVRDIHVLSEAEIPWLPEAAGAGTGRLCVTQLAARPTFDQLLRVSNQLLAEGSDTIAVMNADISIASQADADKILDALAILQARQEPVVLALARHETGSAVPELSLYDSNGLPNYISADCWVFQRPISLQRDLFYAPGQMNCDMFLAHDLLASSCRLYNPCLDIVLRHHEPEKDEVFYKAKLQEKPVQTLLEKHVALNGIHPFNYFGTPWVKTGWLRLGYRPGPASTNGKRLILALPAGTEHRFAGQIDRLAALILAHDLDVQVVCDGDLDRLVTENAARLATLPRILLTAPRGSLSDLRRALLAGNQYSFNRFAFVSDLSRLDDAILAASDGVFIGGEADGYVRTEDVVGCTLITSVYKSDPFIRGFIRNMTACVGYDQMIEHIFLVSKLSETEIGALSDLLERKPNVLVFWNRTDPGLYNCWNLGLRLARTEYVSNANVDDLRDPLHVVTLVRDLEMRPGAVVAASALVPFHAYPADGSPPEPQPVWYADQAGRFGFFDLARLSKDETPRLVPHNIPHCMPVWRRALHDRYGYFDEARFGTYADWVFWLKVLQDGADGFLSHEPLSFYFVNPTSHNRRGSDLEHFHAEAEAAFLPAFLARRDGRAPWIGRVLPPAVRKLNLTGREQYFGRHRNAFSRLIEALDPLDSGPGGCRLIPFVERYFVWGGAPGEAASGQPRPITEDWIGILHVPFDAPDWFNRSVSPESLLTSSLWQDSRPACRGIITLSADLERDLRAHLPGLPTLAVLHPTELDVPMFDMAAYLATPRVVQVGDWLRKLQAIHRLQAPDHQKIMLLKRYTEAYLKHEIAVFGDHRDPAVILHHLVPDAEYDSLLASSVVLCLMYGTAANNVVIECIARATPLLINALPAVVEYLGADYPLYARDEQEAARLLSQPDLIHAAHRYLLARRNQIDMSYDGFYRAVAGSEFYARL